MMMLIAGTVPIKDLSLITGEVHAEGEYLSLNGYRIPRTQGTGAMLGAALATTEYLKLDAPHALLVGDLGQGKGSREFYQYLIDRISELSPDILALHYCLPDMALTRKLCEAVEKCKKRGVNKSK